jgi:hypothetical protein
MIGADIRSEGFMAAKVVKIFSGCQPCQCHQTLMMRTEMVCETSVIFNELTMLIAREYFINMIAALAEDLARIAAWRLNILRFIHHIPLFLEVDASEYFKIVSSIEHFYVHLCLSNYSVRLQLTCVPSF